MKSPIGRSSSELLHRFENEVIPQLAVEQVFTAPEHSWKQRSTAKWKGGCPWHDSRSGTAFVVDAGSLQWYCAGCHLGGGPVQYLNRLRGGVGVSPRGEDFITIMRELFDLAGVGFPSRALNPEEAERIERRDARRAALQTVIRVTQECLWSEDGANARGYLNARGFSAEQTRDLGFGFYSSAFRVRAEPANTGHDSQSIDDASAAWPRLEGYIVAGWCLMNRPYLGSVRRSMKSIRLITLVQLRNCFRSSTHRFAANWPARRLHRPIDTPATHA